MNLNDVKKWVKNEIKTNGLHLSHPNGESWEHDIVAMLCESPLIESDWKIMTQDEITQELGEFYRFHEVYFHGVMVKILKSDFYFVHYGHNRFATKYVIDRAIPITKTESKMDTEKLYGIMVAKTIGMVSDMIETLATGKMSVARWIRKYSGKSVGMLLDADGTPIDGYIVKEKGRYLQYSEYYNSVTYSPSERGASLFCLEQARALLVEFPLATIERV